jgi:hypothetical protein
MIIIIIIIITTSFKTNLEAIPGKHLVYSSQETGILATPGKKGL